MQSCTGGARNCAREEIAQALALIETAKKRRLSAQRAFPNPKIKPLVLRAAPDANVRRTPTRLFECYIGEKRIRSKSCDAHKTANDAWVCLARFITSRDFVARAGTAASAQAGATA